MVSPTVPATESHAAVRFEVIAPALPPSPHHAVAITPVTISMFSVHLHIRALLPLALPTVVPLSSGLVFLGSIKLAAPLLMVEASPDVPAPVTVVAIILWLVLPRLHLVQAVHIR